MDIRNHTFAELTGRKDGNFSLQDIMTFVRDNEIRMINFMYPAADGRLKTLNFVIDTEEYLHSVLTCGERVDGSSLFPFIEAGNSDLYVIPRLSTAFIDPFEELPTLCFLCAYFDKDGNRLEYSPEYTLSKAKKIFREKTGMDFEAMGELEYYVSAPEEGDLEMYPATDQKGYHESAPFAKFNSFRTRCMYYIMLAGGKIKYGHSEVGNFRAGGKVWEQNEIEFLPVDIEKAADSIMLAKWIIRNLAYEYGLDVSFAPKIAEGKAGSGLHIHMRLMKDGKNMLLDGNGKMRRFSCCSSGISILKASSRAITSSTVSRLSAPRSSMKEASFLMSASFLPSCSAMICLTFCSKSSISYSAELVCVEQTVIRLPKKIF